MPVVAVQLPVLVMRCGFRPHVMIGFKPCFGFEFFSLVVPFLTHLAALLSRKSKLALPLPMPPPPLRRRRNPSRPVAVVVLVLLLAHRRRNPSRLLLLLLVLLLLLLRRRRRRRLVTATIPWWAFQTHDRV